MKIIFYFCLLICFLSQFKFVVILSQPVCLFIHGKGESTHDNIVLDAMPSYWGEHMVQTMANCKARFLKTETAFRGWNDDSLIKDVCNAIDEENPTVIFTHSMGNLIVAAGVHWKYKGCDKIKPRGSGSAPYWFGIQGPWRGSASANLCASFLCKQPELIPIDGSCGCGTDALQSATQDFGFKHPKQNTELAFYCDGDSECTEMADVMGEYLYGNMCGLTPHQMHFEPHADAFLAFVDGLFDWGVDNKTILDPKGYFGNDGLVEMESCRGTYARDSYAKQETSNFYVIKGNHADGTGRYGNKEGNDIFDAQSPLAWYANVATEPLRFFEESLPKIKGAAAKAKVVGTDFGITKDNYGTTHDRLGKPWAALQKQPSSATRNRLKATPGSACARIGGDCIGKNKAKAKGCTPEEGIACGESHHVCCKVEASARMVQLNGFGRRFNK